jgi:hypothetical protein
MSKLNEWQRAQVERDLRCWESDLSVWDRRLIVWERDLRLLQD